MILSGVLRRIFHPNQKQKGDTQTIAIISFRLASNIQHSKRKNSAKNTKNHDAIGSFLRRKKQQSKDKGLSSNPRKEYPMAPHKSASYSPAPVPNKRCKASIVPAKDPARIELDTANANNCFIALS